MNRTAPAKAYAAPLILMHWLMLLLIAMAYALMDLKSIAPRGSALRQNMATLHYLLGLCVFALVWLRLLLRRSGPVPSIEPAPAAWQNRLARAIHGFLYVLMIALPVLGWLALSAKGKPVPLFAFELPLPIAPDALLAGRLKDLHEGIATAGYVAIGLHAAAALFHHYVKHDNTLSRMLPRRFRG